jgi:hypothetical protein
LIIGKYFSSTRSWLTTTTWSVEARPARHARDQVVGEGVDVLVVALGVALSGPM